MRAESLIGRLFGRTFCHMKRVNGALVALTQKDPQLVREGLWQAQTPQMFRLGMLRRALSGVTDRVTDESGAIERAGYAPKLVAGHLANFKLTWPEDFALAESLLQASHPTPRPR